MTDINEQRPKGISRRTIAKGAAWSVPVIATAAATPLAAASTASDVDIRLSLGNAVDFNLNSTAQDVVDAIIDAVSDPLNNVIGGGVALATLKVALNALVSDSAQLLDASITYPEDLTATNFGGGSLDPNEEVQVALDYDNDLVNLGATPIAGANIVQTGSGSTVSYTTSASVDNGADIFTQDLEYNPLSLTISLADKTEKTSTVTADLLTSDADPAGNSASGTIGITVELVSALSDALSPVADMIDLPDITVDLFH